VGGDAVIRYFEWLTTLVECRRARGAAPDSRPSVSCPAGRSSSRAPGSPKIHHRSAAARTGTRRRVRVPHDVCRLEMARLLAPTVLFLEDLDLLARHAVELVRGTPEWAPRVRGMLAPRRERPTLLSPPAAASPSPARSARSPPCVDGRTRGRAKPGRPNGSGLRPPGCSEMRPETAASTGGGGGAEDGRAERAG
jgi:hypothetical protein